MITDLSLRGGRADAAIHYPNTGLLCSFLSLAITILILITPTGCTTIGNWADSAGSHMPTIGEPCYHWQCFTESGQRKSDEIKRAEQAKAEQAKEASQSKEAGQPQEQAK